MEDVSVLKSVVIAANQFSYNKNEVNLLQLQRHLELLQALTNRGNNLKFFNAKHVIPMELLTSLADIVIHADVQSSLASKIMTIFQNLAIDSDIKEVFQTTLDLPATLASFLRIHNGSSSNTILLQCVQLLQELTYNFVISYPNSYIDDLIRFLISKVLESDHDMTVACLGLFANVCRNNSSIQNHVKSLENIKEIYKRLITFLSSRNLTIIVFALSIIASLALLEELGERLFNPKNIHQTFQLIFNILLNSNLATRSYAVDLFMDLLCYSKVQKALSSYKYFLVCLKQVLSLLTLKCTESVFKLLQLLLAFCNVPDLLTVVSKVVLNLSDEEDHSKPNNFFQNLMQLIENSNNNHDEVSQLALSLIHQTLKNQIFMGKELNQLVATILPLLANQLKLSLDKESPLMKNKCSQITKSLEILLLLCQNGVTKVYEIIDATCVCSLIDFQLIHNPTGIINGNNTMNFNWSETGLIVLLLALKLLSKIQEVNSEMQIQFHQYLKDPKLIPFVAYSLSLTSQNEIQLALDLLSSGCKLEEFPLNSLGEILFVNNSHSHHLTDCQYKIPDLIYSRNCFPISLSELCFKEREKLNSKGKTFEASFQAVIDKMESGLEIKDLKYSEIMDMYEHKIATLISKESHLQDLVEAKTVALAQADRLISQYRGRIAQSETEALKLRTLLQSSEKRSEDSKERVLEVEKEKEKLAEEIEYLVQEKQLLEADLEEQREQINEQTENLETVQRNLATLKQEHQSLSEMHEMLRRHNETLKQQQEQLLTQLQQTDEEKKSLSKQLKEKESKVKELSKVVVKLENYNEKKDQELEELQLTVENQRKDLARQEETKKKLQLEVSSLDALRQQHEATIKEKDSLITSQKAEMDKHAQIIAVVHSVSSGKMPLDKIIN